MELYDTTNTLDLKSMTGQALQKCGYDLTEPGTYVANTRAGQATIQVHEKAEGLEPLLVLKNGAFLQRDTGSVNVMHLAGKFDVYATKPTKR